MGNRNLSTNELLAWLVGVFHQCKYLRKYFRVYRRFNMKFYSIRNKFSVRCPHDGWRWSNTYREKEWEQFELQHHPIWNQSEDKSCLFLLLSCGRPNTINKQWNRGKHLQYNAIRLLRFQQHNDVMSELNGTKDCRNSCVYSKDLGPFGLKHSVISCTNVRNQLNQRKFTKSKA